MRKQQLVQATSVTYTPKAIKEPILNYQTLRQFRNSSDYVQLSRATLTANNLIQTNVTRRANLAARVTYSSVPT